MSDPHVAARALAAVGLALLAARLALPRPPRLPSVPVATVAAPPGEGDGRTGSRGTSRTRWVATAGAALAALLVLPLATGLPAACVVGLVVWRRSASWEPAAERRRRARVAADLPHVVDLLAACLAVGAAPSDALRRVVPLLDEPTRGELTAWADRLRWGTDPVVVWTDLAAHPQLGRLGAALRRSAESGAPVVASLDRLAEDLREVGRTEVEARVRQVEVRTAVPLGVCLLPAFLLLGVVPLVAGSALRLLG
jgi:Flp pilus assembly protein TadB